MKVELPRGWEDVTINQFIQISEIKMSEDDEGLESMIEMLSVLSGVERQLLYDVSFVDITNMWKAVNWISDLSFSSEIVDNFIIGDIKYVASLDVRKMTAGQLIDLKHFMSGGKSIENMHNILAIFYFPEGKKYNDVNALEVGQIFAKNLSVAIAYPLQVFFCARSLKWKSLTNRSTSNHLTTKTATRRRLSKTTRKVTHS